jgi:hypothetical protein
LTELLKTATSLGTLTIDETHVTIKTLAKKHLAEHRPRFPASLWAGSYYCHLDKLRSQELEYMPVDTTRKRAFRAGTRKARHVLYRSRKALMLSRKRITFSEREAIYV